MSQPTPPPFAAPKPEGATTHTTPTGQPLPPKEGAVSYQNNPFFIAVDGIKALFKYTQPAAIVLVVLSALVAALNIYSNLASPLSTDESSTQQTEQMTLESLGINASSSEEIGAIIGVGVFIGIIILIAVVLVLVIGALIQGIGDVAAAAAVNKKTLTLGQTFSTLLKRFPGYLWLVFLVAVKTFLWSLLFIVPGIIMAVRYSLAGTAFFAKDMKASEAIRYSTQITKGGWTTLFASDILFNLVTLGTLQPLVRAGVRAIIFEQYHQLASTKTAKPAAHWLSVLTTTLYFLLIVASLALIALILGSIYHIIYTAT